jgi:tetratricopeptide (TPR) repeat protein
VEELVGIRRIRLHRRIGEAIEHHHQDDLDEQLDALAHHFGEAAARGDVDKAVDYLLAAGRRAQRHNAYESAVPAFERALTLLDAGPGDQTRRCDALAALAEAHAALFQDKEARTYALEAIELARELHRPDLVTRAATLDSLNLIDIGGTNEAFAALSEEAVATTEPGTPEWVHAAMYRVVVLLWSAPDANARAEAERLAADALAVSERVDDPEVRLRALLARATVLWGQPGAPELRVVTDEMATVATAMGNLRFTVNATFLGLLARLCLGDRDAFETGLADAERLVAVPFARAWRALAQTMVTLADGRFDDAEHELEAGESLGRENPNFTLGYFAQGAHLRAETGRARPKVLTFWGDLRPGLPALRLQAVLVQAERGRTDPRQLDDARAAWRDLSAQGYAVPLDFGRPIALRLAAEIAAHLDDRDAAAALHPMLADYDGQLLVAYTGTTVEGAAARALGQLEAVLGRDDEAAAHFEAALVLEERVGARALVARTRYWYARLLATRDRAGDAERADAMLAATLDDAATTGMDSLHALARHERGLTGARAT